MLINRGIVRVNDSIIFCHEVVPRGGASGTRVAAKVFCKGARSFLHVDERFLRRAVVTGPAYQELQLPAAHAGIDEFFD